jgi:glycosyltransferase involved in cell wall biosynthesis
VIATSDSLSILPLHEAPAARPAGRPACAAHRVLHLINGEHYSGAERVQDLLAQSLPEIGFDVGFALLKPGHFAERRAAREAPLYLAGMRSRLDLAVARRVSQIVRRERYALVHAHSPRTVLVGLAAARLAGVPLVYHKHCQETETPSAVRRWASTTSERFAASRAAKIVAVSQSVAAYLVRQGYDPRQIAVVPNGICPRGPLPARRPPAGTWTLGVVALFRPRKGLEVLLEALALVRGAGHDVRLRAIGSFESPGHEAEIRALVARLGLAESILWRGFCRDVAGELADTDLFVMPSVLSEGLPMAVLEAMAAGVPVIGTRVDGTRDVIRDGIDGVLAEAGNAADMADLIARFIRGRLDWSAMRSCAHARQAGVFSDASMARGVAEVYRSILRS